MEEAALTIADLLPADFSIDSGQLQLGNSSSLRAPGIEDFIRSKALESIGAVLHVDVMELIAEAWARTDELRELAQATKPASDEPHPVYLLKHDLVCENKLKVALEFGGLPTLTDHLRLKLSARFEGAGLTIEAGHIVAVDAGRGSAMAELLYSNTRLAAQSTDWVTLPARFVLKHPIRIAGIGATQEAHPLAA